MTKLLKTNTAEENIELVRACGTQEEMTELLNTATKEMLIAINNEVYAIRPLSLNIRRMKKHEIVSAIATQIYGQKEAECEAEIISEIESKLPEEKQEFLENCSDDFLEDMCWAYGYKPSEDKKLMASMLAYSEKSVQAKIQAIKEILPTARMNFNFFTDIGKKEQAESYSLCLRRLEAWLKFYQQKLIRSNKL